MKTKLYAFDAELLLYRFSVAKKDGTTPTSSEAMKRLDDYVAEVKTELGDGKVLMVLSDKHNFRKVINRCYKSSRGEKPTVYSSLETSLKEKYKWLSLPWLEADDTLGILATCPYMPYDVVVVSYDKDLQTIPGITIYYKSKDMKVELIQTPNNNIGSFRQGIAGDPTDSYYGIPGSGSKKAEAIVEDDSVATLVKIKELYRWNYLDEDYYLRQMSCAWILRYSDLEFYNSQKIWENPTEIQFSTKFMRGAIDENGFEFMLIDDL